MEAPIYRLENIVHDKRSDETDCIGPLDLILHLLSKNKLEIKDIPVAQILDQYMDWVAQRQEMDLEVASEFIAMAAHLLYIKSRMLVSAQDEEALSEVEQLIASLEERQRHDDYQRIKLGIPTLAVCYEKGSAYLTKPPEPLPETGKRHEYHHERTELLCAMEAIFARNRSRLPPSPVQFQGLVGREPYPVDRAADELLARLQVGRALLTELWQDSQSRSELVAVFIAVLELCRTGQICLLLDEEENVIASLGQAQKEYSA